MLQYNLDSLIVNSHIMAEIRKGIYGLPHAGIIARERLNEFLAKHGYIPSKSTPGLYKHNTRHTIFTLVVDNFGVKFHNVTDALYMIICTKEKYAITTI